MCNLSKGTLALLILILSHVEIWAIATNSIINYDVSIRHGGNTSTKNELYLSSAIKRGIEKIISESPYHRNKIQKEGLINKIEELIFNHGKKSDIKSRNKSVHIVGKRKGIYNEHYVDTGIVTKLEKR